MQSAAFGREHVVPSLLVAVLVVAAGVLVGSRIAHRQHAAIAQMMVNAVAPQHAVRPSIPASSDPPGVRTAAARRRPAAAHSRGSAQVPVAATRTPRRTASPAHAHRHARPVHRVGRHRAARHGPTHGRAHAAWKRHRRARPHGDHRRGGRAHAHHGHAHRRHGRR